MSPRQAKSLDAQINDYMLTASGHRKSSKSFVDGRQVAAFGAAAASSAVMMAQAEAAVVHNQGTAQPVMVTASVTGSTGSDNANTPFDMNDDGVNDFYLEALVLYASSLYQGGRLIVGPQNPQNELLMAANEFIPKLSSGAAIGPTPPVGHTWETGIDADFAASNSGALNGSNGWVGSVGETGIVGVRFNIGGNTHYGWIRLSFDDYAAGHLFSGSAIEWAYESCPDTPIAAGDTDGDATCAAVNVPIMGPAAYGLTALALGGLGLGNLRRRRREREQAAAKH